MQSLLAARVHKHPVSKCMTAHRVHHFDLWCTRTERLLRNSMNCGIYTPAAVWVSLENTERT